MLSLTFCSLSYHYQLSYQSLSVAPINYFHNCYLLIIITTPRRQAIQDVWVKLNI